MANFDDTVTSLLLSQPFYGQLLMRYRHICAKDFPYLAAVSTSSLYYNPDRWAELSDDEAMFVLTHEVSHGVFLHVEAGKEYHRTGLGPDGQPYDARLLNAAQDFVINDGLKVNKIGVMPKSGGLWDQRYTYKMTPEEVYVELKKAQSKGNPPPGTGTPGGSGGAGNGDPIGFDLHDISDDVDPTTGQVMAPAVTPADILQAAMTAKAMGSMPVGLDRILDQLRKPKHSPWKRLRRAMQSTMSGNDTSSWRRPQRRLITRGIVAPGRAAFGCGTIGVVVDTSGSIGDEILSLFGGHMGAILTDAKPKEIRVYWTDAKVHRVDVIKTGAQLRSMLNQPVPGGGGTDMTEGVDAAIKDGCESVVVLTDGYTPFGQPARRPVIWAMTTDKVAPHGTTINISE